MKKRRLLVVSILLLTALVLSSCARNVIPTTDISSSILTAVAQTLTAQYTPMVATATLEPITPSPSATIGAIVNPTKPVVTISTSACDSALFVSDITIPDNTVLTAGTTFTKTWQVKNVGTCSWSTSYSIKFVSGNSMGASSSAISSSVNTNGTTNVSVSLTAPTTPGLYTGYWRMANASGTVFGEYMTVVIIVGTTATTTITPTITMTPTPTITPYYIIVTATPMPSSTETPTPTATTTSAS